MKRIAPSISFSYDSDKDVSRHSYIPSVRKTTPPMKNKNETKIVFHGIFYLKYVFGGPCLCNHLLHYAICSLLTGAGNAVSLLGLMSSSSSDEIFFESFVLTFLSTIF